MSIEMSFSYPTPEEYVNLRVLADMSPRDVEGAKIGLANSNHMVTCRDQGTLVGMGRIIGDQATTFQIVDVAVHPNYQGKGLGKRIMQELMKYLEKNASPNSYVSLLADGDAKYLYEKFGFKLSAPDDSLGMHLFMNE